MSKITFTPIPTTHAQDFWSGAPDAHDMTPERHVSDGLSVPCRHCLKTVAAGEEYLVLAYRPFDTAQPYAEIGPIFLHAEPCEAYNQDILPALFLGGEPRLLKGYGYDNRIIYGTGRIVEPDDITDYAGNLLDDPSVAYIHMRSSLNNCYSCRIDRADVQ